MTINKISGINKLKELVSNNKKAYLLLYKSGSEQSDCALVNFTKSSNLTDGLVLLSADVSEVRDIHPVYGIQSVPALLEFDSGELRNVIKGCQQPQVLKSFFEEAAYRATMEKEGRRVRQVTVYSTPTCSWCTTLKSYLRKNKVYYTEVDISRDPGAAQNLVSRTGQQGVPQTEIDGSWVVGFDQKKLNTLLEIK